MHRTTNAARLFADRTQAERASLLVAYEACLACELACVLAAESAARMDGRNAPRGMFATATICGDTAAVLARMSAPDGRRVIDELVACRAACAVARLECLARPDDPLALRCAIECERCERACHAVLAPYALAA